jgi:Holliday junction DNA helicase RuvA
LIEYMQGELQSKGANYVVIQVGGIGYRLYVSALTMAKLPSISEEVTVFVYLHVREDELSLYGFLSAEEKGIFLSLLQVSGIGPKLALAILSRLSVSELHNAIVSGDTQSLLIVPGVGKKTAGRLILELKDKLAKTVLPEEINSEAAVINSDARSEAVSALLSLGYSLAEAQKVVPIVQGEKDYTAEELIRLALKQLAKY